MLLAIVFSLSLLVLVSKSDIDNLEQCIGTFGDKMDVIEIQSEIKSQLDLLGWSQKKLARELYMDEFEYDDELEIRRYEERVKKALSRSTTKFELLRGYLNFIRSHPTFCKQRLVANTFQPRECLTSEQLDVMKEFSSSVDKKIT
ncbi:hypothetical protein C9I99_05505 [Photobacterium lutimaris]|uniref:Uncharacterized protein n=1 Tax=Photobacterium lutimaris TaxID=388278 RepID=A0A2T3J0I8_9GAMM|nr:hypothetical protein C9I99_05505 [Photobacterium lutimaris]